MSIQDGSGWVDLEFYRQNGFALAESVISAEWCDRLIAAAHELPSVDPDKLRPAIQPHRQDDRFLEFMRHPPLVRAMESILGGEISGLQSEFFFTRPGTHGFTAHQDNFFVEADTEAFASAWTALVDVTPRNGALTVFPGTHAGPILPIRPLTGEGDDGQDPNARNEEAILPADAPGIQVAAPKGSVIFLHGHAAHLSGVNRSESCRYALLNTFIRKGARFRPGRHAKRMEVDLSA